MGGFLRGLASLCYGLGVLSFVGFGIWGFVIEMQIVHHAAGFWGVVLGLFVAPVVLFAAPIYAVLQWGDWLPIFVVYGGTVVAGAFLVTASAFGGVADRLAMAPTDDLDEII